MRVLPSTSMLPVALVEAVERLYGLGFSELDINYYNIDLVEAEHPTVLNMYRVALMKTVELGVKAVTLHAPWETYYLSFLGSGVDRAVAEARMLLDLAASYGVEIVVFHPIRSQYVGSGRVDWLNKKMIGMLAEYVEREGLRLTIAVENLSRGLPWSRLEQLDRLIAGLGYDNVGICIDTGHMHLNGYSLVDAESVASRLLCVHVNDNKGRRDEHLPPGAGGINWAGIATGRLGTEPSAWVAETHCAVVDPVVCASQARAAYAAVKSLLR